MYWFAHPIYINHNSCDGFIFYLQFLHRAWSKRKKFKNIFKEFMHIFQESNLLKILQPFTFLGFIKKQRIWSFFSNILWDNVPIDFWMKLSFLKSLSAQFHYNSIFLYNLYKIIHEFWLVTLSTSKSIHDHRKDTESFNMGPWLKRLLVSPVTLSPTRKMLKNNPNASPETPPIIPYKSNIRPKIDYCCHIQFATAYW